MFKLYHTYKKKLVEFKPIKKGKIGMYNCGPTVYDHLTIGNLKTFVFEDVLRRSLEYLGYEVKQVMNITDVGHLTMTEAQKEAAKLKSGKLEITDTDEGLDRIEKAAKREGITVWEVAEKYTEAIFGKDWENKKELGEDGDFCKLNILKPHVLPKATDHIPEQIDLIKMLEQKGFTYKTKKAVYFDVKKFPRYEELAGQQFEDMEKGERADTSDPDRKHPADFRLWQLDQPDHAMQWDSPWGRGFPGWHIECSAMSTKYLGQPFDIHTGGEDHIKVHHPDEIAQSESAFNKPMANYWLHGAFMTVDGKRMGKSLGNAYTLADVEKKGFDPLDLRYFYLLAHYRSKQNFTWEGLESARNAREKLRTTLNQLQTSSPRRRTNVCSPALNRAEDQFLSKNFKKRFIKAIEDDLNMPEALAVVWDLAKSEEVQGAVKLATLMDFDSVLGLRLGEEKKEPEIPAETKKEIEELIAQRDKARKNKDWKKADEIRETLTEKFNAKLEDTEEGTQWRVV